MDKQLTAKELIEYMMTLQDDKQAAILRKFFKCKPGEYGYGDKFLGIKNPQTRIIVKNADNLPLDEVPELLDNDWHEIRLCGFLIMVSHFEKKAKKRLEWDEEATRQRDRIVELYLQYALRANNWDLVDLSVHKILGQWLLMPTYLGGKGVMNMHESYKIKVLDNLANSDNLWKQRMSIVCSWRTSAAGDSSICLRYAEKHLKHKHDLMHKAVGWMLREMGKRVSMDLLREFLEKHVHEMPRTTLRYAIEKMQLHERQYWMKR